MTRSFNRPLSLAIPEDVGRQLDRLARDAHRRPRDHAELLLVEAVAREAWRRERTEQEELMAMGIDRATKSAAQLADEFEAEARRLLLEADADEMNTFTRLSLRMRGEAWLKAAARLRLALPPAEPERTERPSAA
jgi:hypothetical protein